MKKLLDMRMRVWPMNFISEWKISLWTNSWKRIEWQWHLCLQIKSLSENILKRKTSSLKTNFNKCKPSQPKYFNSSQFLRTWSSSLSRLSANFKNPKSLFNPQSKTSMDRNQTHTLWPLMTNLNKSYHLSWRNSKRQRMIIPRSKKTSMSLNLRTIPSKSLSRSQLNSPKKILSKTPSRSPSKSP